jgi:hypothetical protein
MQRNCLQPGSVKNFIQTVESYIFFPNEPPSLKILIELAERGSIIHRDFEMLSDEDKDTFGNPNLTKRIVLLSLNHCFARAEEIKRQNNGHSITIIR